MTPRSQIVEELLGNEPAHPLLPLPKPEEVIRLLGTPEGAKQMSDLLDYRRGIINAAQRDPVRCELEPPHWEDVRRGMSEKIKVAIILGGNRSGKSRLCGKMTVQALIANPGTLVLCVSEDETASRETQQKIIWHYLPPEIKARCHNRRDPAGCFYVNYSEANGFSERKLVLPLPDPKAWAKERPGKPFPQFPSKILFATYGENPDDYEGLEFGHQTEWATSWWADENLRLAWLKMFTRRGKFRPGTGLWSYTPIHGITPTIKEAVGAARTIEHRPSLLLLDRVNLPGLPVGTMPYIQQPSLEGGRVYYFFSEMSPFGPGPNGSGKPYSESVAEDCALKPSEYVQRIAYGYTEDVMGRCYPTFRPDAHVVRPEELPALGSNYCFIDPAGDRNWFLLWVRIPPGSPRRMIVYREWPDVRRYGEWAVPTTRSVTMDSKKGWDGDRGPAQRNMGWGVVRYKQLMAAEERVPMVLSPTGCWTERDPQRKALLDEAMLGEKLEPMKRVETPWGGIDLVWSEEAVRTFKDRNSEPVRERIRIRKVDPRAGANPQASARGGVNILTLFAEEQRNGKGELDGPRMLLIPAYTGRGIDDGISHVNELLSFNAEEPLCPVLNEPRLLVSSECSQILWMLNNYTAQGGEDAGCKDPADLVRYMAQDDDLRYVDATGIIKTGGFSDGF